MNERQICCDILSSFPDGVYFVDRSEQILYWNEAAERITGYTQREAVYRYCHEDALQHVDARGQSLCKGRCPLADIFFGQKVHMFQSYLRHKDGRLVLVWVRMMPIREDGRVIGVAVVFTDDVRQAIDHFQVDDLINMATTDSLTNLVNRRGLESALGQWLLRLKRYRERFCVLFFDIDNFKQVNDRYGHETGDRVLCSISDNLLRALDGNDAVGRWGGEEFLGIYAVSSDFEAERLVRRIRTLLRHVRVRIEKDDVLVTVSIGATMAAREDTPGSLVSRADKLMYHSKLSGKNCTSADFGGTVRLLSGGKIGYT